MLCSPDNVGTCRAAAVDLFPARNLCSASLIQVWTKLIKAEQLPPHPSYFFFFHSYPGALRKRFLIMNSTFIFKTLMFRCLFLKMYLSFK